MAVSSSSSFADGYISKLVQEKDNELKKNKIDEDNEAKEKEIDEVSGGQDKVFNEILNSSPAATRRQREKKTEEDLGSQVNQISYILDISQLKYR